MKYQFLPDLTVEEFSELKEDIQRRGVQVPIEFDEDGNVLDGHHRLMACEELDIDDFPEIIREGLSEQEKRCHVISLNLTRRNLSRTRKRELVSLVLSDNPKKSNRQIGKELGVSHETVRTARKELESIDQIGQCSTVQTSDGRQYPTRREPAPVNPESAVPQFEPGESHRPASVSIPLDVEGAINAILKWFDEEEREQIKKGI